MPFSRTCPARAETDAAANAGGYGDSDDEDGRSSHLRRRYGQRHARKMWSGTVGVAMARCVRRTGPAVDADGEFLYAPACPTGIDTGGSWPQLPPATGALVDGSLAYAYTRHLSFTGAFAYEPLPGTLVPEFLVSYAQPLHSDLEISHEISTFLVWQRGQPAAAVPEALRWTETVAWTLHALELEGGAFIEPSFGLLGPEDSSEGIRLPAPTRSINNKLLNGQPQSPAEFSLTSGLSAAAELRLTRHWAVASALTVSNRSGEGYGPKTLINWNLIAVILHYRGWSDQLALELASEHPGGPYNAAVELSLARHL